MCRVVPGKEVPSWRTTARDQGKIAWHFQRTCHPSNTKLLPTDLISQGSLIRTQHTLRPPPHLRHVLTTMEGTISMEVIRVRSRYGLPADH